MLTRMLETLRNLTGGRGAQKHAEELEKLIAKAREERSALNEMLSSLTTRGAKLQPMSKSLDQMTEKASAATAKLDDIARRLTALDDRTKELDEVDRKIQALKDAARQAEQTTEKAIGPDGELRKHREAVQQLSQQALQTQATLDTLKKERAALEELRTKLRESETEVKQATAQAGNLKSDLDQIRATAANLTQDYGKIRETSREAREDTTAAMSAAKDIEKKLEPLTQLHELSQSTAERLASINSLAEHVGRKAKALDSQQQAVEHAVVQANRVSEMVWQMDAQIVKLNEGMKQLAKSEETLGRIEKLSDDTNQRVEASAKLNDDVQREVARQQKDSSALLDAVRTEVGTLAIRKREFEAFDERVRGLQASVGDAETRMGTLSAKEKNLLALDQKVDGLNKRVEGLFAQADDLTQKQIKLEALNERLAQVDELSKKASWQMDSLKQSRQDLEVLKGEVQALRSKRSASARPRCRYARPSSKPRWTRSSARCRSSKRARRRRHG